MSKRGIRCVLLGVLMSLAFSINSYAIEMPPMNYVDNEGSETVTRAEQVRWYFRKYKGVKQKRLWSITYGYWKTGWITL